jgi:hypothetical protein
MRPRFTLGEVKVGELVDVDCGYSSEQMRREVILFMAFALGGCLPDQVKASDVAACKIEADRFYQNGVDVNNPRSQYIIECMAVKGYDFEISPTDCDSRRPLANQPACYASQSWMVWIADQLRAH